MPYVKNTNQGSAQCLDLVLIKFDVVEARIPCLLSRFSLVKMNATLQFGSRELWIRNKFRIALVESSSGRFFFPFDLPSAAICVEESVRKTVYPLTAPLESPALSEAQLMKIHIHLGHAPLARLVDILRKAARKLDKALLKND